MQGSLQFCLFFALCSPCSRDVPSSAKGWRVEAAMVRGRGMCDDGCKNGNTAQTRSRQRSSSGDGEVAVLVEGVLAKGWEEE